MRNVAHHATFKSQKTRPQLEPRGLRKKRLPFLRIKILVVVRGFEVDAARFAPAFRQQPKLHIYNAP